MPFRKKVLYYGLLLLLTLLALEGMARIAYYAAYGHWYGGGLDMPNGIYPHQIPHAQPLRPNLLPTLPATTEYRGTIRQPFHAFTPAPAYAELNTMPPRQRRKDTVLIGLLGGSVAEEVKPFLQRALNRRFAANSGSRRPAVLPLAVTGAKQPQQTLIVANALLLGGEFDLIVNLDGFNELNSSAVLNYWDGLFPFFPYQWDKRVGLTGAEALLAGRIGILRREQARRAAAWENSPLRWSALFGLASRWRQENNAAQIIRLNHKLAATAADWNLEKHGPRTWPAAAGERRQESARIWYRSSAMLARLAEVAGAEYYHFLQPNQYVPDSKPLSPEERELAYKPALHYRALVEPGYPLLQGFCRDLQNRGVPCFDLTGIFAAHPETLYIDECCHLNDRGSELLAAAMVQRLEPALLRLGGAKPAGPGSALAAGRYPEKFAAAGYPDFQVSLAAEGKELRYVRESCTPEALEPLFFLHLMPRDLADLPPPRREPGFANRGFSFAAAGGRREKEVCTAQIRLPDYPLAAIRTGQHIPGQGDLWSAELTIPADSVKLRAEYAALSTAEPAARSYFALYRRDNRLIYLRESCAAADMAAEFFLHIVPEDPADLPEDRQAAGFAHGGFAFARQGGPFDGKCLATVPLPDYPIKEMRTGQFVPGQGELWSVELIVAP